jgi:hypothetical protein
MFFGVLNSMALVAEHAKVGTWFMSLSSPLLSQFAAKPLQFLLVVARQYQVVAGFFFLAHRLAEITISASGKFHSFDLSFDDDLAETETSLADRRLPRANYQ